MPDHQEEIMVEQLKKCRGLNLEETPKLVRDKMAKLVKNINFKEWNLRVLADVLFRLEKVILEA